MITETTDKTFTEDTAKGLVIVDFWAPWCGPCRTQGPILDQISDEFDDSELKIVKMDVDENPNTATMYGIMSIPTLMFKKDGEVVKQVTGVHTKDQILKLVKEVAGDRVVKSDY